jgi:hypothetical protein
VFAGFQPELRILRSFAVLHRSSLRDSRLRRLWMTKPRFQLASLNILSNPATDNVLST